WGPSETLAKPLSDAGEVAARTCLRIPPTSRFEVFEMRRLRVDQEAGGDRKGRALGRVRQSGDTERAPDAHRPVENAAGKLGQAGELTGTAGQHHAAARFAGERRSREPVA